MGPLDQSRPWETKAVVGVFRLLQRIWRNVVDEDTGERPRRRRRPPTTRRARAPAPDDRRRARRHGGAALQHGDRPHHRAQQPPHRRATPTAACRARWPSRWCCMLAPLAPHVAEELWPRLGHDRVAGLGAVPRGRPGAAGRRHGRDPGAGQRQGPGPASRSPSGLDAADLEAAARADAKVAELLDGATVRKVIAVPDKLVNFVVG